VQCAPENKLHTLAGLSNVLEDVCPQSDMPRGRGKVLPYIGHIYWSTETEIVVDSADGRGVCLARVYVRTCKSTKSAILPVDHPVGRLKGAVILPADHTLEEKLTCIKQQLALQTLSPSLRWQTFFVQFFQTGSRASDELSDTAVPTNKTWPRPQIHLIVDGRKKGESLCRTLFSAVVQGYPSPVLVGYRETDETSIGITELSEAALWVISDYRSHIKDGDIVMWLGKENLIQLPTEVIVRRFLQQREVLEGRLARRYPTLNIHPRIFFPAAKTCLCNPWSETQFGPLPESSLPQDIYGSFQEESLADAKFRRSRYLEHGAFVGEASAVASFFKAVLEATETDNATNSNETAIWKQLFLHQELARQEHSYPNKTKVEKIIDSVSHILYNERGPLYRQNNLTTRSPNSSLSDTDLGIHLDYESRLFQPLTPDTENDVHPLTFNNPTQAISPSKLAAHLYGEPLRLPPELPLHVSPFTKVTLNTDPELLDEDLQKELIRLKEEAKWSTLPLLTNVAVPRGSVPAVLLPSEESFEETWKNMWFWPYGRVMLGGYLHPDWKALGEVVWNERGGAGGVWTDLGELILSREGWSC